ncbi:MmyB family transcriptional regulator [Nocardiopsis lambiniae]|uniref:MmyB family transcriptional regulator n=1 Tax=Nocardiopsis lambiniae TaxID=3075539 RepID=UPI0037C5524B
MCGGFSDGSDPPADRHRQVVLDGIRRPARGSHRTSGVKRMDHPMVGRMEKDFETLDIPGGPGQRIITYDAGPGSPSEPALWTLCAAADPPATSRRLRLAGA